MVFIQITPGIGKVSGREIIDHRLIAVVTHMLQSLSHIDSITQLGGNLQAQCLQAGFNAVTQGVCVWACSHGGHRSET